MNNTEQPQTCQHSSCDCTTPEGQEYCSDHCKNAPQGGSEMDCQCGHPQCK